LQARDPLRGCDQPQRRAVGARLVLDGQHRRAHPRILPARWDRRQGTLGGVRFKGGGSWHSVIALEPPSVRHRAVDVAMPMSTSPLARLGHFRGRAARLLHPPRGRAVRAGDALLCAPGDHLGGPAQPERPTEGTGRGRPPQPPSARGWHQLLARSRRPSS
jgi:hypothetical protein